MTYELTVVLRPTRNRWRYDARAYNFEAKTHRIEGKFLHIIHTEGIQSFRLKGIESYFVTEVSDALPDS
jgi:hypothetical protein